MKQGKFQIRNNTALTDNVYKMVLAGDTSAITAPGQFVNIQLAGKFLRRPISVCDWDDKALTIIYKVVGKGTEQMSAMVVVYTFVKKVAPAEIYKNDQQKTPKKGSLKYLVYVIIGLVVLSPIGLLASGTAFGEWDKTELLHRLKLEHISSSVPAGMNHGFNYTALFGDYTIPGTSLPIGYILSAITAILIFFLISKVLMAVYEIGRAHV